MKNNSNDDLTAVVQDNATDEEDAFAAIQELDDILDIHDEEKTLATIRIDDNNLNDNQQKNINDIDNYDNNKHNYHKHNADKQNDNAHIEENVEEQSEQHITDCLQDLDNYLEQIDIMNDRKMQQNIDDNDRDIDRELKFQRGSGTRNTISCTAEKIVYALRDSMQPLNINEGECNTMNVATAFPNYNRSKNTNSNYNSMTHDVSNQTLTPEHIYQNILEQSESYRQTNEFRPRQYGRRAESIVTVTGFYNPPLTLNNDNCILMNLHNHSRPFSAPLTHAAIAYHNRDEFNPTSYINNNNHNNDNDNDNNNNNMIQMNNSDISTIRSTSQNTNQTSTISIETNSIISNSSRSSCTLATESLTQIGTEMIINDDNQSNNDNNNSNSNNINNNHNNNDNSRNNNNNMNHNDINDNNDNDDTPATLCAAMKRNDNNKWPYNCCRTFALLSCSLGLFNICRFALLTINYGGNFLIQFLLLSLIFGIPFFWLQMCLGAKIKNGPITMWRISPICCGIGFALIAIQFVIAVYSAVILVWLLLYLLDTFKYQSLYPWGQMQYSMPMMKLYTIQKQQPQQPQQHHQYQQQNHSYDELLHNLTQTIPDYFNIVILKRLQFLLPPSLYNDIDNDHESNHDRIIQFRLNDQVAISLVILWLCIFLILSKGLQSFGRILICFTPISLTAFIVVTGNFLTLIDITKFQSIFSSTALDDFLTNSKTWNAAAQETFLTWSLLGASVIAITCRPLNKQTTPNNKYPLRCDALLIVLFTFIGLCLAALLGLSCGQILNDAALVYVPGSYETPESSHSIYSMKALLNGELISYPSKLVPHYSGYIGDIYLRPILLKKKESGYQILRFVTELLPAVVVAHTKDISWIWTAILFLILFIIGLNQLCVAWYPISTVLGNSSKAIFISCLCALILCLPFATDNGIIMLHYMDFIMGGAWFIPVLWTLEIFAIFLVRGRPYNGDHLVDDLHLPNVVAAYLAYSWNVLLPIGLISLAVINYKISYSSQLYYWRVKSHFSYWARKIGALTQIGLILLVPIVAIIQIYRYLSSGPPDILDRIQLLYRPPEVVTNRRRRRHSWTSTNRIIEMNRCRMEQNITDTSDQVSFRVDAPPKYTPPPSYTTATGTRLAKLLRSSIRRSVRRILGTNANRSMIMLNTDCDSDLPNYSNVSTYPSGALNDTNPSISETIEIEQRPNINRSRYTNRTLSLGRDEITRKRRYQRPSSASRVLDDRNIISDESQFRRTNITAHTHSHMQRPYTAEDVITILRSSTINRHRIQTPLGLSGRSNENLVLNAEPPALSTAILQSDDQAEC